MCEFGPPPPRKIPTDQPSRSMPGRQPMASKSDSVLNNRVPVSRPSNAAVIFDASSEQSTPPV